MSRKALGRGLGALFPQELESTAAGEGLLQVPLDQIQPSPWQPRREIKEEELAELAASIRAQGVLQPVLLRPTPGGTAAGATAYQLIAGERRWRAAKMAGLATIPALVRQVTDAEALEVALVENLLREDLDPLEEAEAYKKLIEVFKLTQEDVAQRVGKDRSSITNALRLLRLPDFLKEALSQGRLSLSQAKVLLTMNKMEDIMAAGQTVLEKGLSVRETESQVKHWHDRLKTREPKAKKIIAPGKYEHSPQIKNLENQLRERLGTQVRILRPHGKAGHIVIEFYSDDDLDRIYEMICGR
jgi:ParB family chromosome partitioning protein